MKTIGCIPFAVLAVLTVSSWAAADEPAPAPQVEMVALKLRVVEALPGQAPKILANPTLMTVTGREIRLTSGGAMKSKFDDRKHDLGTQITATIEPHKNDHYQLKLQLTLGTLNLPEQEPETELFLEQKLTARTIVEAGKMKKLAASPSRWVEITIEKPTSHPQPNVGTIPGTSISKTSASTPARVAPAPAATPLTPMADANFRYVEKLPGYVER